MVQAKPTIENKTITCPFCEKGEINVLYTSEYMSMHAAHAAGKSSRIPNYHPERYDVSSKCPECGKSSREIRDVLMEGGSKPKTHEERLKRLQASGLPTRVISKR